MDRIGVVKGPRDVEFCLFDVIHRELALRLSQAHFDAFKPVVHHDDTLVPKETELVR